LSADGFNRVSIVVRNEKRMNSLRAYFPDWLIDTLYSLIINHLYNKQTIIMRKIKVIHSSSGSSLEAKVNQFLSDIIGSRVISIQYSTSMSPYANSYSVCIDYIS